MDNKGTCVLDPCHIQFLYADVRTAQFCRIFHIEDTDKSSDEKHCNSAAILKKLNTCYAWGCALGEKGGRVKNTWKVYIVAQAIIQCKANY